MDWLTDNKIPIGKWAAAIFDWLQINGGWFFDGLSDALDALIEAILWVLQTPRSGSFSYSTRAIGKRRPIA